MATRITTPIEEDESAWTISILPRGEVEDEVEDEAQQAQARLLAMLASMLLGHDSLDDGEEA